MYNSELWTLIQTLENSIDLFQRKLLRRIINVKWPRSISNEELYARIDSNPRISFFIVSLVKLPMYNSSISDLCMFFLLLLTISVHSQSSVWIDFWWPARRQSAPDFFFLSSVCSSFSLFEVFSLFFLLFISSIFFLGWDSALVPSRLEGILINDYY